MKTSKKAPKNKNNAGTCLGKSCNPKLHSDSVPRRLAFNSTITTAFPPIQNPGLMKQRFSTPKIAGFNETLFLSDSPESLIYGNLSDSSLDPNCVYNEYLQTLITESAITEKLNQSVIEIDGKLSLLTKRLEENRSELTDTNNRIKNITFLAEHEAVLDNLFTVQTLATSAMKDKSTIQILSTLKSLEQQCCNELPYDVNKIYIDKEETLKACCALHKSVKIPILTEKVCNVTRVVQQFNVYDNLEKNLEVVSNSSADNLTKYAKLILEENSTNLERVISKCFF